MALLLGLGVRGIVRDDVRYAWGMFPYALKYTVEYRWRLADDTKVAFVPGREIRRTKKVFAPTKEHVHGYGVGAVRTELTAYARAVVARTATERKARPANARAFEVELRTRKHGVRGDPGDVEVIRIALEDAR